jgi:hypothetical protein
MKLKTDELEGTTANPVREQLDAALELDRMLSALASPGGWEKDAGASPN